MSLGQISLCTAYSPSRNIPIKPLYNPPIINRSLDYGSFGGLKRYNVSNLMFMPELQATELQGIEGGRHPALDAARCEFLGSSIHVPLRV